MGAAGGSTGADWMSRDVILPGNAIARSDKIEALPLRGGPFLAARARRVV